MREQSRERNPAGGRVLVVGAGPVGCVVALELARHGVPSVVVDRSTAPPVFPKMDFINGRSMELLRRFGLVDQVRAGGVDGGHGADFHWTTGLAEPPVAVWSYPSPRELAARAAGVRDGSAPVEVYQRIQGTVLEETLRRAVRAHPLVEVREGWTFTGLFEDVGGITATLLCAETASRHTLRARFLVGCDGASSVVRGCLDIPLVSSGQGSSRCSVYFRSSDPVLRAHGRAFVTIGSRGLTLVSRDEGAVWTASFQVPEDEPFAGDPMAVVRDKLGVDFAVDEVLSVGQWRGALAVAARYRRGSVFLAGDSAHQFYPFGGHGANTGIADGVDLGWKLAAVVNGWGGPRLLDSYEAERRPVALFNREMSADLLEVWRRYTRLAADGATREQLGGLLAREASQVDNPGVHFGYRYACSPVVAHEDGPAPAWHWDRITPTPWPGGRAPAVPLPDGTALFDRFGTGLTLVDLTGRDLGADLAKRAAGMGVPVDHLVVDDPDVRAVWGHGLVLVRPDQHVAWRGEGVPADWDAVLELVCGR